jgi:hypothetical protein
VLEHLTVLEVKKAVANMVRLTSKFIYVTTRFHPNRRRCSTSTPATIWIPRTLRSSQGHAPLMLCSRAAARGPISRQDGLGRKGVSWFSKRSNGGVRVPPAGDRCGGDRRSGDGPRPLSRLEGFSNDHFQYLAAAQQMRLGEWPTRDFADPGMPLMYAASAAAQVVFGRSLFAEAMLMAIVYGVTSCSS